MEVIVTKPLFLKTHLPVRNPLHPRELVGRILVIVALSAIAILLVFDLKAVQAQPVELVKVDLAVVAKGYRASDLIGNDVVNAAAEDIGTLDDIIIDLNRKLYAVLEVGSFLGLGGYLVVIPYESLKIDESGERIELAGASKGELQKLDEFKYTEK